jgi:hypothetical protein
MSLCPSSGAINRLLMMINDLIYSMQSFQHYITLHELQAVDLAVTAIGYWQPTDFIEKN